MEFDQNNLNHLGEGVQGSEQTTVVANATEAMRALEENNRGDSARKKWTTQEKIELVEIEMEERSKGLLFMERVKKRWDERHPERKLNKQNLRDNAARFKKDKKLMNLMLVKKRKSSNEASDGENDADGTREEEDPGDREEHEEEHVNQELEEEDVDQGVLEGEQADQEELEENDVEERDQVLYRKFCNYLQGVKRVGQNGFEGRDKLSKVKQLGGNEDSANRILTKYLQNHGEMSEIVDAVYAMGLAVCDAIGVKEERPMHSTRKQGKSNRREREKESKIKELRQFIARADNEIHRRKVRRRASNKEKKIISNLKEKIGSKRLTNEQLKAKKEEWLDELRTEKVVLKVMQTRKKRIKNNTLFRENQRKLFADDGEERVGELPEIEKFEEFWSNIWEKDDKTPDEPWMERIAEEIRAKVREVQDMEPTMDQLKKTIKKRKNWSAPGLDGIQNFWWKKFSGAWQPMLDAIKEWLEDPGKILDWLLLGRTVLIPKTINLDLVAEFRPITCLNTVYKIFTGLLGDYMKKHVVRNRLWDENQLGTKENVLGTVDLLLVDQCIMEEVKNHHRDVAVSYYDYKKAYDYVHHDWINRVFEWIGIDVKVRNVVLKIMGGWKTRLEVSHNGESKKSRWIRFNQGFLQGDSFSPVGFCICEIPVLMLIDSSKGYRMGPPGYRIVNKTHSLFLDDLKVYQETEQQLEVVNEILVQASEDTGARYGVKKCCKAVFKHGKLVATEGLKIKEESTGVLDPMEENTYKFLGLEQAGGISRKLTMEKMQTVVKKEVEKLVEYELYDKNLMEAINTKVVPIVAYAMNVIKFTRTDLTELDMIVKRVLRLKKMHAMQGSDERLYLPRDAGGRGLKSFKTVYEETKIRMVCYMCKSEDPAIINTWERELNKENYSMAKEVIKVFEEIGHRLEFNFDDIVLDEKVLVGGYSEVYKVMKATYKKGKVIWIQEKYSRKELQSEVYRNQEKECHVWLKGNLDPVKTAAIIQLMEQMVETKVWKVSRGIAVGDDKCRLCGKYRETVHHILSGCPVLAQQEYLARHNAALSLMITEWCKKEGLMAEEERWYKVKWFRGKVLEGNGKKVLWDFQFKARKTNIHRRPDAILEDAEKKVIWIVDMACPMECNILKKTNEKLRNYQQLAFETREKRPGFKVVIVPLIIGCAGGGVHSFLKYAKQLISDEKKLQWITQEMVKTVVFHSETIMRKIMSGLVQSS